jgi:flagellar FliJ protein
MAYRFQLETLLKIRCRRLEIAEADLSRAHKKSVQTKKALDAIAKNRRKVERELEKLLSKGLRASEYQRHIQYVDALMNEQESLGKELARCQIEVQKARYALLVKHREKELVERLRERDFAAYGEDERRLAQKEADDISAIRHGYKRLT